MDTYISDQGYYVDGRKVIDATKFYVTTDDNVGGGGNIDITQVVDLSSNQDISGVKTFTQTISGDITGNAATVTNGVYLIGDQTIDGVKTFTQTISGDITGNAATATKLATARSIAGVSFDGTSNINIPGVNTTGNLSGNAATVTNGVYTTGSQTIAGVKTFSSTIAGSINGNAATATALTSGDKEIGGNIYLGTSASPISKPSTFYYQTHNGVTGNSQFYLENNNTFVVEINSEPRMYIRPLGSQTESSFLASFTGQHRNFVNEVHHDIVDKYIGLIVSANKNTYTSVSFNTNKGNRAIQINESLPDVRLSTVAYDKTCYGVISGAEDPESREDNYGSITVPIPKELGDTRLFINSLGEGAVWIVNTNGILGSGDYITTSNVKGYGQKQDSEFLANYTVAKITMDCDFQPVTQPVQIIKKEYNDVNYWVKTTYKTIDYETYSKLPEDKRLANTETVYTKDQNTISVSEYTTLDPTVQSTYNETIQTIYQEIIKEESTTEQQDYTLDVRQELVNVLDEHGEFQWEDDPSGATEKAYQIRYLDANGLETDESNAVHTAAFVGCTYHCG